MTDDKMSFCAEGIEHAGELDGNVASSDNGDLFGLLLNIKKAVTVDTQLGAGNIGRDSRLSTNGNKDILGVDDDLGAIIFGDFNLVLVQNSAPSVLVFDVVVGEVALIYSIEAFDVGVTLKLEGGPVEGGSVLDREAICLGVVNGLCKGGSVISDLFGDAAGRRC